MKHDEASRVGKGRFGFKCEHNCLTNRNGRSTEHEISGCEVELTEGCFVANSNKPGLSHCANVH